MAGTMFTRAGILVLLLAGIAWVTMQRGDRAGEAEGASATFAATDEPAGASSTAQARKGLPGKSVERPSKAAVTAEETIQLLRETIITFAEYETQTLAERTDAIKTHLKEAGIPPHRLRVEMSHRLGRDEHASEWKFEAFQLRNIPAADVVNYTCGSTKIVYRVRPGVVEFALATEPLPDASKPNTLPPGDIDDPFESAPNTIPPVE
jgi:hypothetical protein